MREFFTMMGFPTIIVLGSDGAELDRMVGFDGDAEKFVATLDDWSQNENTIFAYLQKWAEDTTDVEWNYRIAKRYLDRYQNEFAQRFFHNVLKLDPQDNAGYKRSAEFNVALYEARTEGNPDKLAALLESETDQERLRAGYFSLARVYESKNDIEKTIATYKAGLEKMPNDAGMMNAAAWFIYEQKASDYYSWGISIAQKAVALQPKEGAIWDTLAWLLHANGQYKDAVDAMSKVVELDPSSEYSRQMLQQMKSDLEKNS